MLEKKTKIVCTIGPATWDPSVMRALIENGMNCARVNGAFADPDELDKVAKLVRDVSNKVALMVDIKGPEIRMNKFSAPVKIKPKDIIVIGSKETDQIFPANHMDLHKVIKVGQRLVVGDGDVELMVKEIKDGNMHCEVVYGEELKPGKALNLPGANLFTESLTEKDKINLKHSIETGWDFVSASFIRDAKSAQEIKDYIGDSKMKLIAKIEDQEGVDNIDEILEVVDGVMIARGGLGVELGLEMVPIVQRKLTKKCIDAGKPVITATQMLESMIQNPRPTRAEVSDVATAILLGTDAVMLSGESSAGEYPIDAVKFLTSTAKVIESHIAPQILPTKVHYSSTADAIAKATAEMCINLEDEIDTVIIVSRTGTTARLLSRHSVRQPIYAFVSNEFYMRTLMLNKGIRDVFAFEGAAFGTDEFKKENAMSSVIEMALSEGIIKKGQKILFVGKTPVKDKNFFPNVFEIIDV